MNPESLAPQDYLPYQKLLRELFAPLPPVYLTMKFDRAGLTAESLRPYRRFLRSLFTHVTSTYLGNEPGLTYSRKDRQAHVTWCLTQALKECQADGCRYEENQELLDYLHEYLRVNFYKVAVLPTLDELDLLLKPEAVSVRSDLNDLLALWTIFEATPRSGRRLRTRTSQA